MNESKRLYIYVLKHENFHGEDVTFYVGKSHDPKSREKEHVYSSKKGLEDKYTRIRQLESEGLKWWSETVIEINLKRGLPQDYERYYVIHYARLNCPLTNMKHGDLVSAEEIKRQILDSSLQSVEDIRNERVADEELKKSKAFLAKVKREEIKSEKEKKKANRDLFKLRKENFQLIKDTLYSLQFSIHIDKGDLTKEGEFTRHLPGWTKIIEHRLQLPHHWMDAKQNTIPKTQVVLRLMADRKEEQLENTRRKKEEFRLNNIRDKEFKKEQERKRKSDNLVFNAIVKWFAFIRNGGAPSPKFKLADFSKHRHNDSICVSTLSLKDKSSKYSPYITLLYSDWLRDMDQEFPDCISCDYTYKLLGDKLTNAEFNRKMSLLWICFKAGGLKKFSATIKKSPEIIKPYIKRYDSKPIPSELSNAIEKRFGFEKGIMDARRNYLFKPPEETEWDKSQRKWREKRDMDDDMYLYDDW